MKLSKMIPQYLPLTIKIMFILLLVYAAVSKLLDHDTFETQLGQSPIFSAYAVLIAWMVPIVELVLAGWLVFQKYVRYAYYLILALMVMFTAYIVLILNFSDHIPCSCGGILEDLDWTEHFIFNMCFVFMAIYAIIVQERMAFKINTSQ